MTDIYQTPKSNLSRENEKYKPGKVWKVIFIILVPLEIWSQYDSLVVNEMQHPYWWLIFGLLVYTTYLVGLFGFAFAKKIGTAKFWFYYLPVLMLTDCFEIYSIITTDEEFQSMYVAIVMLLLVMPLVVLFWWTIYKYSRVIDDFA